MKTKELLLECKVKLKVETDYALAKALDIPRQRISELMNGSRKPDAYACFKIAEALNRDPATVIAEIQAEEGGKHAAYFMDFLWRRGLLFVAAASLSTSSAFYAPESIAAEFTSPAHNDKLWKTRRRRARQLDRATQTALGRFFYARRGVGRTHAARGGRRPFKSAATWELGTPPETPSPSRADGRCLRTVAHNFGG